MKFITKYQAGEMSLAQARSYAFKTLSNNPGLCLEIAQAGIIRPEEAHQYAVSYLQENPYHVFRFLHANIISREEAAPFVFRASFTQPEYLGDGVERGVFTFEQAKAMASMIVEKIPANAFYYLSQNLIEVEDAKTFILSNETLGCMVLYPKFVSSGLIAPEEAKESLLRNYNRGISKALLDTKMLTPEDVMLRYPELIHGLLRDRLTTKEAAKPYALRAMSTRINLTALYLGEGLITEEEAKPFVLENINTEVSIIIDLFRSGHLTREEARAYALKQLQTHPSNLLEYFKNNIISKEEATQPALATLEQTPLLAEAYFRAGILKLFQVRKYALKAIEQRHHYFTADFQEQIRKPFGGDHYLNQLVKDGVDLQEVIDDDLKFLLEELI